MHRNQTFISIHWRMTLIADISDDSVKGSYRGARLPKDVQSLRRKQDTAGRNVLSETRGSTHQEHQLADSVGQPCQFPRQSIKSQASDPESGGVCVQVTIAFYNYRRNATDTHAVAS